MWDWLWGKRESVHEEMDRLEEEIRQIDENLKMLEDQPIPDVPLEKVEVPVEKPPDPVPEPTKPEPEPVKEEPKPRLDIANLPLPIIYWDFGAMAQSGERLEAGHKLMSDYLEKRLLELCLPKAIFEAKEQPKEKPMSKKKMEIARLVDLLKTFVAKAGTLHPEQLDRLDGVQNGLEAMLQEVEDETYFRIYWVEGKCSFTGLCNEDGFPLFCRDWDTAQAYSKSKVERVLEGLKGVEDMTLKVIESDEHPDDEPEEVQTTSRKADMVNVRDYFVVWHPDHKGGYWSDHPSGWGELRNAKEFDNLEGARSWAMSYSVFKAEVHEIERTETHEDSDGAPVAIVHTKCAVKAKHPVMDEKPKDEKRYGIRFREDGYITSTPTTGSLYPWGWNPLYCRDARKFTLDEAKTLLKQFTEKTNCLSCLIDQKFLAVVEISEDYKSVTPVDGWAKPAEEKRFGVKLNDRGFLCSYPATQETTGWSWVTLTMSHKPAKLTLEEARTALNRYLTEPNQLRDRWAKPENPCVVEFSEDGKTFTPVVEKKYAVWLAPDKWLCSDTLWTYTTKSYDNHPRKVFATAQEAKDAIERMISSGRLSGYHATATVEEVDDVWPIKDKKYVVKIHKAANEYIGGFHPNDHLRYSPVSNGSKDHKPYQFNSREEAEAAVTWVRQYKLLAYDEGLGVEEVEI